ncbi:8618_t:CDS:1, partial [Paraglomus occultum]
DEIAANDIGMLPKKSKHLVVSLLSRQHTLGLSLPRHLVHS